MDAFDVVIVGGGPAGSSCAWGLRNSGLRVAILDRAQFPRDKVCGGWIAPPVLAALAINPLEYARGRTLQPFTGFRTSVLGGRELETRPGEVVSWGIRRCEFDAFLLARSGAAVFEGVDAGPIRRSGGTWTVAAGLRLASSWAPEVTSAPSLASLARLRRANRQSSHRKPNSRSLPVRSSEKRRNSISCPT